jgi:RHS repeat-associated protein
MGAGTVLWVSVERDAVVTVRGDYVEPGQWSIPVGETFVAVPALEAQPLRLPMGVSVWRHDAPNRRWQAGLTGDLASVSNLPSTLAPGEAIYVQSNEPTDLGVPAPEDRIRYYHQDHLGSSSAMTDANGAPVEETAFYPFGIPRHEHQPRQIEEHYKFTQKERDRESGLHYFEVRYLVASLSRFAIPDPKYAHPDALVKADFTRFHALGYLALFAFLFSPNCFAADNVRLHWAALIPTTVFNPRTLSTAPVPWPFNAVASPPVLVGAKFTYSNTAPRRANSSAWKRISRSKIVTTATLRKRPAPDFRTPALPRSKTGALGPRNP